MKAGIWALTLAGLLAAAPALAEETDAERAQRWQDLSHAIFQDHAIETSAGLIRLEAPVRALEASLVPVTVTIAPDTKVAALYLIVDDNPSPLVGTFHFGPAADPHELRTRIRVDAYTNVHAVVETVDGHLYATSAFVKAAGGCSAPGSADPAEELARIGQMRLKVQGEPIAGQTAHAELLISHPNYNGMQMDQVTRLFTPARYIQTVHVTLGDRKVFDLDADISLSEDPAISFGFIPAAAGDALKVEVEDSTKATFRHSFDVAAKPS